MKFWDTLPEDVQVHIENEISDHLFNCWFDDQMDEGEEYAEHELIKWATPEIKAQYVAFYDIQPDDPYYFKTKEVKHEV